MERLRRVAALWGWLPVFRAVAETQHLRAAAQQLHISPSALSRTIRLLEDELGTPVFRRVGRRIELNETGNALLEAVRDSMQIVHDSLLRIESRALEGDIHIWAPGTLTHAFLVPALDRLQEEYPKLVPHLHTERDEEIEERVLRGELDILLTTYPLKHRALVSRHLGTQTIGIYCGRNHPLHGRDDVTIDDLQPYPFVTPPPDRRGLTSEGWPPELPRRVGATASSLHAGIDICRGGRFLSVFPDAVVASRAQELYRLPLEVVPPMPFFLGYRRTLGTAGNHEPSRCEAVVEVLSEVICERLEPRQPPLTRAASEFGLSRPLL